MLSIGMRFKLHTLCAGVTNKMRHNVYKFHKYSTGMSFSWVECAFYCQFCSSHFLSNHL